MDSQECDADDDIECGSGESGEDDDRDDPLNIGNLLSSQVPQHQQVSQTQINRGNQPSNDEELQYEIDEESFADYMINNDLIRDNWDLDLNVTDNIGTDEINKNTILQLMKKCRTFIKMLRQSTVLSSYFDQTRREMKTKRQLPFDCPTRWNSTFFLLNSFIHSKKVIIQFFGNKSRYDVRYPLIRQLSSIELTYTDWDLLEDLHSVLKPFYFGTIFMSKRSYPTAGLCYYVVKIIRNFLMRNEPNESIRFKALKVMLLRQLDGYFYSNTGQLNIMKVRLTKEIIYFPRVLTETNELFC